VIITSEDREISYEIILNDGDDPYSSYTIRAFIKGEFNIFSGQNHRIHFSSFDSFLKQFAEFIKNREGDVTLEMTEDCNVKFFRWNAKGDVGVKAHITKYRFDIDSTRKERVSLEVEFKIDGEYVNRIYDDFLNLKRA
jgi:hypothetical protein